MATSEQLELREAILDRLEQGAASELRDLLGEQHPADIANVLESLPNEQRSEVWLEVSEPVMGVILTEVSDGVRERLLEVMEPRALVRAIRNLDLDKIVDLIPDKSSRIFADIMLASDAQRRELLDTVLDYGENTAGRLINDDVVSVRGRLPISVILRYLRQRGKLPEHTDRLYVTSREGVLRGVLLLRTLVVADPDDKVEDHMVEPVSFKPEQPAEEVAASFERYNLDAAAIVDDAGKLLGRVTIDDVVDVIRDSAHRRFMVQAGLDTEDDIFAPVPKAARKRALWLGVNLLTAVLASWVIAQFEHAIEQLVALAVLMPVIASMGGNAGTQTLTSVIRGIGVGTISRANAKDVLKREILIGSLNGFLWALAVSVIAIIWYQNVGLAFIVALAMLVNIGVAALSGVLIPIALDRLGIDPAVAGGVGLTTVTDVVGFLAILGLAALFLL